MNQSDLDPQPTPEVYRIPLTQGQFAIVDKEDFEWLSQWKWFAWWNPNSQSFYATRADRSTHRRVQVYMHRLIMGNPRGKQVDHRNLDTLDDRRFNLRIATHSQNQQNRSKTKRNTSGFKGVTWVKRRGRWQAQTGVNGKYVYLGMYDTAEEAYEAVKRGIAKLHGDFARAS